MGQRYYPYFRGKQFELIAIRECATPSLVKSFVPIIEPVRETLRGLEKSLEAVRDAHGKAILIVNPFYGDHSGDSDSISNMIGTNYDDCEFISAGILLRNDTTTEDALRLAEAHRDHRPTLVHAGFTEPRKLAEALQEHTDLTKAQHVFIEEHAQLLYRKHFKDATRILLRDGFRRQRNADYPPVEKFSELHLTYDDMVMDGFGDFLIVGDDYSEGGGPAYAVAIHLTFIKHDAEDVMYIHHFVSDSNDTPTDPAGKFAEALQKLTETLDSGTSMLYETSAIEEFRKLHRKGHFPGLGYVKKLSMKHHIETVARHLESVS